MEIIDASLSGCDSYDEFLQKMKTADVEIKQGKHLAFKAPGQQRFIRCKSLGDDYAEAAIRERIAGKRVIASKKKATVSKAEKQSTTLPILPPTNRNLLIDIQAKIQQGMGPGFEHWAKINNIKEAAKTLMFLQERDLTDYEALAKKASAAKKKFNDHSGRIKMIDTRLGEIATLQKHIGIYSKTLNVYRQYRDSGWNKKFYVNHEPAITAHKAAKKFFDEQKLAKLPTIKTLQTEYATLAAEKKKLYQNHRLEKNEMIALLTAKQNVDMLLGTAPTQEKNRESAKPEL